MYLFVNEGDKVYEGSAAIPDKRACCGYDAWENTVYKADAVWNADAEQTEVGLVLEPLKSRIFIFDEKENVEDGVVRIDSVQHVVHYAGVGMGGR